MTRPVTAMKARMGDETGMTTAEYAVGTVAACGLGGLLVKILTSDTFATLLDRIFTNALGPFLG